MGLGLNCHVCGSSHHTVMKLAIYNVFCPYTLAIAKVLRFIPNCLTNSTVHLHCHSFYDERIMIQKYMHAGINNESSLYTSSLIKVDRCKKQEPAVI